MNAVVFEGEPVALADGESVLDALLRQGHSIPNGCRAGVCQSCLLGAEDDVHIGAAQTGLSDAQKQLNYFLSCQCVPAEVINVRRVDTAGSRVEGVVVEKRQLNEQVWLLRLRADFDYLPGQYVTLWRDDSLARSYSLASLPSADGVIECHIRHYPGGQFSSWVANEAQAGDRVGVQGPLGKCVYSGDSERPLLLAAIGTGLAPIWGILRTALAQQHRGAINVVVGAKAPSDFYLHNELQLIAAMQPNVAVHLVCQDELAGTESFAVQQADIYQYCKQQFADMKGYGVYLCGAQTFVSKLRKQCFLAGANMADINADIFIPFGGP
ncbi:2Fe-2S iron-sulfur cluster binding domain-containing protein [Pseudomaricurvus alcaniphilus]|uniref:FAD-binding oxidoreductase n=1 Tax=Pseudomaricurvus alcaniphilus TaxID=1166482 RepID=UPI00140C3D45|nr:FAD-binding oxidoreductase [Pseudomaricurvus alcaniphilus]NHN38155.1 2Fe-2S iron-sulfur cluster binding domain-containing protein [Pseudomaricurvus alcaniphilus]